MKNTIINILNTVILITATSFGTYAQTNVSGGIYADTTWTLANSPYIVVDNIVIFPGVTLTIEPGVVVKFDDTKSLEIRQGSLIANGNASDSITFTSNSSTPIPGIWGSNSYGGIWFSSSSGASSFNFITMQYATTGIYNGNLTGGIKNSTFINNLSGLDYITTTIDSCIFKHNVNGINFCNGCSLNFCNISNNNNGIGRGGGFITNCVIDSNQTGLGGISSVDGAIMYNCSINYNQTGMTDQMGGGNTIINCTFNYNSVRGLALYGNGWLDSVINCEIKFNGIGLIAADCPIFGNQSLFTGCNIESNVIGIQVAGCCHIYCNRFCNNTSYDLENLTNGSYSVPGNYWCTSDSATVEALIYDGYDNTSRGLVSFMPLDTVQCYLATGIPFYEEPSLSFRIFPNPASNILTIDQPMQVSKTEAKIFNVFGELVYYSKLLEQRTTIDVSTLPSGIYIIQIATSNKIASQKFIRQ